MSSHLNKITKVVLAFVEAESWSDSQEIVEQEHQLLFSEEANLVFSNLLEQYKNDPNMTQMLQEHQALLKACQIEGIETAFARKITQMVPLGLPPELVSRLLAVSSEEEMTELKQAHPEIQAALDRLTNVAQQAFAEVIAERQTQLPRLGARVNVTLTPEKRQQLSNKLKVFMAKETMPESEAYLEEHPELVTQEGLAVMEMLVKRAQQTKDEEIIEHFMEHHDLLSDAFDHKIDLELANFFLEKEPINVWDLLQELMECEDSEDVMDLVEEFPELLSDHIDIIIEQSIAHTLAEDQTGNVEWANRLREHHLVLQQLRKEELGKE